MPSSKAKAKNAAAHQHDKRHESGLAAPGKRVVRQRSHNNLLASNGHVNGRPTPPLDSLQTSATTSALAAAATDQYLENGRLVQNGRSFSGASLHGKCREEAAGSGECLDRDRTNSDASHDGLHSLQHGVDAEDGQPDDMAGGYYGINDTARRFGQSSSSTSSLAAVSTILTYYPLRDAISILILLLSLPATLVLVIQTLFASLTFVPPTAGISLPSIKEIFNASSLGYPALATILFVDLLFYLCWLPLWRPVQDILLDLSQAVVAVSLSGAAASTGGPTYSVVACSTLVCMVHVLRYKAIHLTALDYLRSVLHKADLGINLSVPFTSNSFFSVQPSEHDWIYTAVRTILGIHIVSQGLTICIRRSLANQNEKNVTAPPLCRADTEAAPGHDPVAARAGSVSDPSLQSHIASTPPNGSTTVSGRDNRTRESGRRRRKQATEVRGNQPLWAAVASTKVTFVKEMEQRDAADDAKEALAMERLTTSDHVLAKPTSNRIWMSQIQDTEVSLYAELATDKRQPMSADNSSDQQRPFYVRVNGAVWNSIKATSAPLSSKPLHTMLDIFGLAPHTSYQCDVFATDSNALLCSVSFVTQLARAAEQATPVVPSPPPPPPTHQALRPSSPATTLRKSIEQASANLAEAKNRTKKTRKDQRSAYSDIRKEINTLKSKLDNSGGSDDKQARRLQQIMQHKNQAEDAAVHILRQIDELGDVPAEHVATADENKHSWQSASDERAEAQKAFDDVKAELDKQLRELKSDITATELKRERLSTRRQQRKDELASVAAKHQAELTARQKHTLERAAKRDEQEKLEAQMRFHIASMNNEADIHNAKAVEAYQQAQSLQSNWSDQPHERSATSSPDHGRHGVPADALHAHANGFYGPHVYEVPFMHHQQQQQQQQHQQQQNHAPRGRSSSMLSQYSGFTESGDPEVIQVHHQSAWPLHKTGFGTAVIDDRKASEGSSGSSGTNDSTASSSPRPDALARPFVPSKMSPIAPPARRSPQTSTLTARTPPNGTPGNW